MFYGWISDCKYDNLTWWIEMGMLYCLGPFHPVIPWLCFSQVAEYLLDHMWRWSMCNSVCMGALLRSIAFPLTSLIFSLEMMKVVMMMITMEYHFFPLNFRFIYYRYLLCSKRRGECVKLSSLTCRPRHLLFKKSFSHYFFGNVSS